MTARPTRLADVEVLTFDCYGTLIDWELGAKGTLRALLAVKDSRADEEAFFQSWERAQRARIDGAYAPYRHIAADCFFEVSRSMQLPVTADDAAHFADSISTWPPFPDTVAALTSLKQHLKLGIISNIDDDILAGTRRQLGVEFDFLMTAQQARAYKPSPVVFEAALQLIGRPPDRIAHAAFGFEYDIAAAQAKSMRTILVKRQRTAFPASPVPDLIVNNLAELAALFA
jgi:2-haloacid dehalogenase